MHPASRILPDGSLALEWTRRARGQWGWLDGVETALVEEVESYEIGAGPTAAPIRSWSSATTLLTIEMPELVDLPAGTTIWVRQLGSFARSPALPLHLID